MRDNKISAERHAAIFGLHDDMDRSGGRKRKCKSCGDWHSTEKPWPHNCRPPRREMQILDAPRIISDVEPHVDGGVLIDSRQKQREYMKKNGLIEHEDFTATAGTGKQDFNSRTYEEELVQDIKKSLQEDPLNRPPPQMIEEANEKVSADEVISTEGMEVIGDERTATP